MDFASFLIQTLNSLQYGLLLFLVASGLTLVFGIMGIINLAHGSFYMIGAYLAFVLTSATGSLVLAIVLGIPLALAFGAFLEWALFSHLYKRDHLEQVLLTYGLILIFEQLRSLLVGDDVHGVAIPAFLDASIQLTEVMSYPVYRLAISVICIVLAVALYYVIQRTRLGMMIRAGNDDRGMVEALGININMIYRVVFALGVARSVESFAAIGRPGHAAGGLGVVLGAGVQGRQQVGLAGAGFEHADRQATQARERIIGIHQHRRHRQPGVVCRRVAEFEAVDPARRHRRAAGRVDEATGGRQLRRERAAVAAFRQPLERHRGR